MKIYSKLWFVPLGPDPHPIVISRSPLVVRNSLPSRKLPQEKGGPRPPTQLTGGL